MLGREGNRRCRVFSRGFGKLWRRQCRFASPEPVGSLGQRIAARFDFIDQRRRRRTKAQRFLDARFENMGEFAQVHGARHPRIALEGMKQAGNGMGCSTPGRILTPQAELLGQPVQLVLGFVKEDREELFVQFILQTWRGRRRRQRNHLGGSQLCLRHDLLRCPGFLCRDRHRHLGLRLGFGEEDIAQGIDQLRLFLRRALERQPLEHGLQGHDRLTGRFKTFDAVRTPAGVAAEQRVLERDGEVVQRHQANGGGNSAEGMGGPRHVKGGRRLRMLVKYSECGDERIEVTTRLFAEDIVKRRRPHGRFFDGV